MKIRALIAVSGLLAYPAFADDQLPPLASLAPVAIAEFVDVTSFPNSIGPRRQDNLKTFKDYGFTDVRLVDETVELYEADGSWMFAITVIYSDDNKAILCILDRALGGPTYNAQKPVAFVPGAERLLVATDEAIDNPSCPTFPVDG